MGGKLTVHDDIASRGISIAITSFTFTIAYPIKNYIFIIISY